MSLEKTYLEYAKALSELTSLKYEIHNKSRLVSDLEEKVLERSKENDGSMVTGDKITGHAFTQISNRLEELISENHKIHAHAYKSPMNPLISPSNLRCFIISLIANARNKGEFRSEKSKNTEGGTEYRYTININKWNTDDKTLQFVAIVEDNHLKTGFFNWIQK